MNSSVVAVNMSSVQGLRDFINERLSAAASEIFGVVEQTIVQYERELDRQRRLRDNSWKPGILAQRAELLEQHVCKEEEEILLDEPLCDPEKNSNLDREESQPALTEEDQEDAKPLQIKEDQEEHLSGHNGDQLVLKEEIDTFMEPPCYQDVFHNQPNSVPLLYHNFSLTENGDENGSNPEVSLSSRSAELLPEPNINHSLNLDIIPVIQSPGDILPVKKPAKCDICGKAFRDQYLMRRHRRIHTGEKPYTCETCGKSFRYSYHLSDHTRTHTGERPYECNICGRRFTDPSGLRAHAGIHTGKKPYSCKICGKTFRQSGNMSIHMKIHTGEKPFDCPLCGKSFIQKSSVKSHMRIHTGEKRFSCEVCGKTFGYRHSMRSHVKNRHT